MTLSRFDDENPTALPLTVPVPLVEEPVLHLVVEEDTPSLSGEDVRHIVALHVAATLLPVNAPLTTREEVRARWFTVLQAITHIPHHPEWALAYLPGLHPCDADAYAVHLPTEHVFGGCSNTSIQFRESTDHWLTRLATMLPQA